MATNETNTGTLQPKTDQAVAPRGSNSERFTAKVMKEFGRLRRRSAFVRTPTTKTTSTTTTSP